MLASQRTLKSFAIRFVHSLPSCIVLILPYHTPRIAPFGKVPTLIPQEVFDHAVANYTPLVACLYGLTTASVNDQDFQSQYIAVVTAGDMLERYAMRDPSHFQLMLAG